MCTMRRNTYRMSDPYIKVGAGVVILRDGKTLLAKRKGSFASGHWGSIGGHVEFGETPIEALKREAIEELGVEIGNVQFVMCADIQKFGKHYLDVSFTAEILSGEPRICEVDRIEEIGWFPLDQLPEPLFDPVRMVLESLATKQRYFETKEGV